MDGDLLGDMAFAAPSTGGSSESHPMAPPTPAMDLLSGSPIKTKEQAPPGSAINALKNGEESDADFGGSSQVSQLPFSDNPSEFQTHLPAAPQEEQHGNVNDLLDFPASSAETTPSDLFAGAKPFSDDPQPSLDPFAPPTQQTKGDASFDPFSDQPMAPQTDPLAAPAANSTIENGFAPFSDQPSQPPAPDLFAAPLPAAQTPAEIANHPPGDPFAPKEQADSNPLGTKTSDLLGNSNTTSEETITPNDAVGNLDDGKGAPESEGEVTAAEAEGTTTTTQHATDQKDGLSKLDDVTMAPESVQSPLETSSDKKTSIEKKADNINGATAAEMKEELTVTSPDKEVLPKEDAIPNIPEKDSRPSLDPPESSTPENPKEKGESSGDAKQSTIGESGTKPPPPNKPQNGSDAKAENAKSIDSNVAPTKSQIQGNASQPNENPNGVPTAPPVDASQQTPKARETVKAIPTKKMGAANQKLDFGIASNMFRSFSSKSGAQLKQLQSKGGASLKVGLSRLGEASSNLADTIKQKNAASNAFKEEEFPRTEKMQTSGSQPPLIGDPGKKQATNKKSVNEMSDAVASVAGNATKATVSEEKKDEGNAVEDQQTNGAKAPTAPASKDTVASAAIATDGPEKKATVVSNSISEPVKAKTSGQQKETADSESKVKDVKQGLTAATVTSLFGLKIEKLPVATTIVDNAKTKETEKKKSVPKKVQQSEKEGDMDTSSTAQPHKRGNKGQHTSATKEGSAVNQPKTDTSEESESKEEFAQKTLETKETKAGELTEEKKQEQVELPSEGGTSEEDERMEATVAQAAPISEQTAKLSEHIAALEKELRSSKEGSSKQIQSLKKELQTNKDGAAKQIQTLQKELQASKDGSSRLIKSLEKKLHGSQETVKQLKEKSMKLQQGAEENELKKDLIEDLNSRLQTEMSNRQQSESTGKKTKEKLDKVVEQFNTLQKTSKERLLQMKGAIDKLMQSNKKMEEEIVGIREERDEQGRRLSSYTTELNEAKKNSAIKSNASEHYELKMNELDAQLKKTRDQMAQIKFERDRLRKELGNWKKYAEDRNKQLEGQLNHEKKLNEERKRRMKFFVEAKTEEARSSNVDNVSLQAELDQTTRSLKDFNQRYKQLHSQWVQAQTRNRELQRDMAKMKNDSEKMSKVGGTLEAKLSRYSKEIEDHKSKRLAAKNELMTVIAKFEEEKKASARLRDFVKNTMTPKVLSQHQVLQDSADHLDGGVRQLALRFGREFASLRRKRNGQSDPVADLKPKTLEEIQAMIGDANTARALAKLEEESQRVNEQISTISTSVEQLESLLVAPTTKGCVGAMFNF